ncbi:MAG: hypothetical protein EI684_14730 [Candidatus Viridilinea halotolerans]|uniref:Uncharacterized protein n=1 Tax=Candidatus Viridilinea halotolerans TaxID=2491704 RepID=A0A426TWE2_9CHLR|nr:MAG: hypothetical protein EI684_14730 [Candidatus Viridilinea halotolerans]
MNETLQMLLLFASGATGSEIVRYILHARRQRRSEQREDGQIEFQQIADLHQQATELREEVRRTNAELRGELAHLRSEVESWRRSYFDLFHTAREIQQQYGLVTAYLNAILVWLKQQNIDIPMPVPVLPELPPLPGPPLNGATTRPAAAPATAPTTTRPTPQQTSAPATTPTNGTTP